jgi:hypothetical protein
MPWAFNLIFHYMVDSLNILYLPIYGYDHGEGLLKHSALSYQHLMQPGYHVKQSYVPLRSCLASFGTKTYMKLYVFPLLYITSSTYKFPFLTAPSKFSASLALATVPPPIFPCAQSLIKTPAIAVNGGTLNGGGLLGSNANPLLDDVLSLEPGMGGFVFAALSFAFDSSSSNFL